MDWSREESEGIFNIRGFEDMAKKMDEDSGNTTKDDANLTMILLSGSLLCSARVQQMIR